MRYNKAWSEAEGIPLVWIPNARHNSPVDNPGFVNAQIGSFIAGFDL